MNRHFFDSFFDDFFNRDPFDDPFFTQPFFGTSRRYTNERRRENQSQKTVSSIEEILEDFLDSQPTILPSSIETIDNEEETQSTAQSNTTTSSNNNYTNAQYEEVEGSVVVMDVSSEKGLNLPTCSICKVEHVDDVEMNERESTTTQREERRGLTTTTTTTTTRTYTDAYGSRTTTTVTTTRGPHGTVTTTTTTTFSSSRPRHSRGGYTWDWNKSKMVDDR